MRYAVRSSARRRALEEKMANDDCDALLLQFLWYLIEASERP